MTTQIWWKDLKMKCNVTIGQYKNFTNTCPFVNLYTHWRRRRLTLAIEIFPTQRLLSTHPSSRSGWMYLKMYCAHFFTAQFRVACALSTWFTSVCRWQCNILQQEGLQRFESVCSESSWCFLLLVEFVCTFVVSGNKSGWRPTYCW